MMRNKLKPRKALNKAFLKVKPSRTAIEAFKTNLIQLLDRTNNTESEEFHKNLVSDFLKKTCCYQLVCQLYGLKEEEIAIVEKSI